MLAGYGEDGFAFGIPGDLDNCLARIDDLARVGLSRRHYAVVRRKEFGVAQLILHDAKIGFRRLHLGFGALKGPERVLIKCTGGPTLLKQGAVAPFLRRSLSNSGIGRREISLSGRHPVLIIDVTELREFLPLCDDCTDIDVTSDEAAAHLKAHRALVTRLNETGAFGNDAKLMGRNNDDSRRSHGSGLGVLIFTTRRYTQAMHVKRNGTDARRMEASDFDLNCFVESTI